MPEGAKEHAVFLHLSLSTVGFTDQHQPPPEPPSILRLKDQHVEPEHQELVRLTLSTGSSYQSPPQKPPPPPLESPPHLSLLQLMPPSSSSSRSLEPSPLELQPRHSWLRILSLSHPSSISSQYLEPPPDFSFPMSYSSSSSRQMHKENVSTLKSSPELATWLQISPPEQPCRTSSSSQSTFPEQPPADQTQPPELTKSSLEAHARFRRARNYKKPGWQPTIEPPYPWASSIRAKVLSMEELLSLNITGISGHVYCQKCKKQLQIEYDLQSKFSEVVSFIAGSIQDMHDRAPNVWLKSQDLDCDFCGKSKCVQPLISTKKRKTNWLFLFLGQMIGYCNLTHLKYFCKHNSHHRTAVKDRLVYLTYTTLHCQLDPKGSHSHVYNT